MGAAFRIGTRAVPESRLGCPERVTCVQHVTVRVASNIGDVCVGHPALSSASPCRVDQREVLGDCLVSFAAAMTLPPTIQFFFYLAFLSVLRLEVAQGGGTPRCKPCHLCVGCTALSVAPHLCRHLLCTYMFTSDRNGCCFSFESCCTRASERAAAPALSERFSCAHACPRPTHFSHRGADLTLSRQFVPTQPFRSHTLPLPKPTQRSSPSLPYHNERTD